VEDTNDLAAARPPADGETTTMNTAPTDPMDARMDELKEVKFQIPVRHHVSLHSWKLLQNKSISGTVVKALEEYFSLHELDAEPAPAF
jgi:hypothetical protein